MSATALAPLPDAPRTVRRGVAGRQLLLPGVAALLLVAGAAGTGGLLWSRGVRPPFDDLALDAGAATAAGEIELVEPGAGRWHRVHFRFTAGGELLDGICIAGAEALPTSGTAVGVEYLPGEPRVSRIVGGSRQLPAGAAGAVFLALAAAGFAGILLWYRGVLRRTLLLRDGRAASARVDGVRRLWPLPAMLVASYHFRDAAQREQRGRQWCTAGSAVGRRLAAGGAGVQVVHGDGPRPRSALTCREDYVAGGG